MSNRINDIVQETRIREGITYRDIAEKCGISEQTLHSSRKRESIGRIGIDVFLKIAHGLGMTAEELYYGDAAAAPEPAPVSAREQQVLDVYRADRSARRTIDHAVADALEDMEEAAKRETRAV